MLNNVKLGVKIGIQLSALICIMLILGIIAIINMKNVSNRSDVMEKEYIPEIRISSDMEREILLTTYHIRGYAFKGEKKFYNQGLENLKNIKQLMEKAKTLSQANINLSSFRQAIENMEKQIVSYEKLLSETAARNDEISKSRKILDKAVEKFISTCQVLLKHQTETLETEITAELETDRIHERLDKLNHINSVMDMLNKTRIENFKFQTLGDSDFIANAQNSFKNIEKELNFLSSRSNLEKNKKMIEQTKDSAYEYRDAMNNVFENQLALADLQIKQNDVAEMILEEAGKITAGGMDQTGEISKANVSSLSNALNIMIIGLILCIFAGIGLAFIITRSITVPISGAVEIANAIAQGDMTQRMVIKDKNEIGELAASLNRSSTDLASMLQQVRESSDELVTASENMSSVSAQLASGSEQASYGIGTMASATEEMSVNANSVSSTADQMSSIMSSIASAIEQMSMSISNIAENAQQGSEISAKAMKISDKATKTINNLGLAASEIGEVTEVIRQIALKTNILALNATIEAASAGEAGKGFAVVANEIKELANQSASSAEDIAKKIKGVQTSTEEVVHSIGNVAEIISNINDSAYHITQAVEQQTETSNDISLNVQQANEGVGNIAASIAEIAKGANDTAKNAGEASKNVNEISKSSFQVKTSSEDLSKLAGRLKEMISKFKTKTETEISL